MVSSIFWLFHRCRKDLWHPKTLGFFALKMLLATVGVLKGAAKGVHSAEEAVVAAFCVSCLERSLRSVSSEHWRNTSIPLLLPCDCVGEALIWYWPWPILVPLCVPMCSVCFVCFCPDGWKSKLLLLPYSIHLNLKRYLYLQLSVPLQATLTVMDTIYSLTSNGRF